MTIGIIMSALLLAGLASPQDAAPASTAPAKADKKLCRQEQVTGSNFPRSICHTKAEWAAIDAANEDSTRQLYGRRTMNAPSR